MRSPRPLALVVAWTAAALLLPSPPASAAVPPPGSAVVLLGDSVPERLDALDARFASALGWDTLDLSRTGCPIFGEQPAWPDGTSKRAYTWCEDIRAVQDAALADSPEVVVWWDRLSQMHFFTGPGNEGGEFVFSGSDRFWAIRRRSLHDLADRIVARGAVLVFVKVEPMGIGVKRPCPTWRESRQCWDFLRFRTLHYEDITRRWNALMHGWVRRHPSEAVFVSITDEMCLVDEAPCDDRINGLPARDDGSHYEGAGATKAARVLVREIRVALRGLT